MFGGGGSGAGDVTGGGYSLCNPSISTVWIYFHLILTLVGVTFLILLVYCQRFHDLGVPKS